MAPFLLQWEVMRFAKAQGQHFYDLLGVTPLEAATGHPWAGISSFKAKFGGQVTLCPPEQQIVLRPWAERLLAMKRMVLG